MLGEFIVLVALRGEDEGTGEAGTVADVIVGVVLGEVVNVLTQEAGLLGVGEVELGGQRQDL